MRYQGLIRRVVRERLGRLPRAVPARRTSYVSVWVATAQDVARLHWRYRRSRRRVAVLSFPQAPLRRSPVRVWGDVVLSTDTVLRYARMGRPPRGVVPSASHGIPDSRRRLEGAKGALTYHPGPSLIIAYSHCIAHGYDLARGMDQQKAAVLSGHWPLFRYNPELRKTGQNPFQLDSKPPTLSLDAYLYNETRYRMLVHSDPERARHLLEQAQNDVKDRWRIYEHWAAMPGETSTPPKP